MVLEFLSKKSTNLNKIRGINHMVDFIVAKVKITFGFSK
jgi:hypothetical protein